MTSVDQVELKGGGVQFRVGKRHPQLLESCITIWPREARWVKVYVRTAVGFAFECVELISCFLQALVF